MSGQFDDADEGEDVLHVVPSEQEFVDAIKAKMKLLTEPTSSPSKKMSRVDFIRVGSGSNPADNYEAKFDVEAPHWNDDEYDDDDDDLYDLLDDDLLSPSSSSSSAMTNKHLADAGNSRINLDDKKMSHAVSNAVTKMQHLESTKRKCHTGRDDRATSEQCLDPRTRLILFRMLSNGFLELIDGCLSTGKEANVYYAKAGRTAGWASSALTGDGSKSASQRSASSDVTFAPHVSPDITEYAIKIYKTSILVFKDRDKYVSGEHRWRKGYCECGPFVDFNLSSGALNSTS